ncbi:hypothetical protein L195_g063156, partial [Trifolium pratense]
PKPAGSPRPREKRARTIQPEIIELEELEIDPKGKTVMSPCWAQPWYFEKFPLAVSGGEKAAILGTDPRKREEVMAQDVAG